MAKRCLAILAIVPLMVLATSGLASAQGNSNSSISGTVVDSGGGAIPGASVVIKGAAGEQFEAVTNADGLFSVPGIGAGTYKATVPLPGVKTVEVEVRVLPNTPASFKAVLEVGQLTETITVSSSSELINTQTATVAATLNADQLNRMPTPTRNALNAVTFLPGINTADTNRESRINGLPESFVQMTLDGVSNNDNFLRSSDSFFASITPRQDAIEAVSVVTAAGGANVGGSGAVSVNFQTRSGTNKFSGTAYEYFRDPALNSNNWLNIRNSLPKNEVKLNQYGGRIGGPIVVPGLLDGRGKAFYMVHYEQLRFPNSFSRTRTILNPAALNGVFRYDVGGVTREVNVLDLARANNQIATIDPTVMSVLRRIQSSTATTGTVEQQSDPLLMNYRWQSPGKLFEHQPTVRVDFNLGDKHRLSGTYANIWAERDPDYLNNADVRFPGSPVYRLYTSTRPLYRIGLRSTLSRSLVSELSGGVTALGGSSSFGSFATNGVGNFADQDGYAIDFDANIGLTNWHTENGFSWRASPTFSIDESLTWQRGSHSVNFGGGFLNVRAWENAIQMVPGINLGFNTNNDPAAGLFATANFAGASAGQLTDARELYALLTGRVTSVTGQAALDADSNTYRAFAPRRREGYIKMYSLYAQDSWRMTPTLTLNAGVRWDVQMPFTAVNDVMSAATMASVCGLSGIGDGGTYSRCNFNQVGAATNAAVPEYIQLTRGTQGYDTDWNNVSPNVGIAWRPNVQGGVMRTLLGDPEQATLRAGLSFAYDRQGMDQFTGVFGPNPGSTLSLTRNESVGLVNPGEQWPVLMSQRNRLYNAPFPETPSYPIAPRANRADDMRAFAPDIKIGVAKTWTVSFQRAVSKDMAVDIRYVGTRGSSQWSTINYNQRQIEKNGFVQEFQLAQGNLVANNASGVANRRGSFAYFGPGTGTTPLPIYLAYLNGSRDVGNPGAYTGGTQTWTNTAITQDLVIANPNPYASAADLDGNLTRRQLAFAAGLAANFFVLNPDINTLNVTDSGAYSDYHALQIDLRRRLSRGLSAAVNYQYAIERGSSFRGFRYGREMQDAANVRHAIKTQWDWTVPVGRGQRFGAGLHPLLDSVIGGWSVNGVGRIQDRLVNIGVDAANDNNFTGVALVGMSKDELQAMYRHAIRINPANGLPTVYLLPDDVILNTRRAFSVDPTSPTGYSELGVPEGRFLAPAGYGNCVQLKAGDCVPATMLIRMPWFVRFDLGITKKFPIRGATNFELRFDVLNLFDNVNFDPVTAPGTGAGIFQTTGFYDDPSNTYDPGGRIGSVMVRVNW